MKDSIEKSLISFFKNIPSNPHYLFLISICDIIIGNYFYISGHYGSVVSSYFTFLRWILSVNITMTIIMMLFVTIPEVSIIFIQ